MSLLDAPAKQWVHFLKHLQGMDFEIREGRHIMTPKFDGYDDGAPVDGQ